MTYSTHQLENMRAIKESLAWKILVEHFAEQREHLIARMFDNDCDESELSRLRAINEGRTEVLEFFDEQLADARMSTRIEE